ncbi:trimethylamine methyltransferase family protein [Desulfosporosinus sp. PR]|uniref:[trimethylamine--corrinoid protein] Co-methyltransferase n=1 Tax=Candidatus Desulfosporosinus nitrosoreducens TaxID=3401928 RepID=UPI0027E9A4D8|nr:trimethylamine methyltransferase family protein [Desulfosporosinus sp. PR]MDQ7096110.1 trimethylamine methyltransferase family protein [Desulfosporosinus sp. PR]
MAVRTLRAGIPMMSGFSLNTFSEEQLELIHCASLEILRDVGVKVELEEATQIFAAAGCMVEKHGDYSLVKIPSYVVEDCLRWAPSSIVFYGRERQDDYAVDGKRTGVSPFGENVQVIDRVSRKVRRSVKQDLAQATLLCDYYDQVPMVERALCSGDQIPGAQTLHNFEAMVTNTSKHILLSFGMGNSAEKILEMAYAVAGSRDAFAKRPFVTAFVCPTSPLVLVRQCCEGTITAARGGAGVAVIPMALSGATAPATLGGTLVQHNAEVLSTLVLAQLTKKGTPTMYCTCSTIMDLRFTMAAVGAPEWGILSAALARVAQYYKLPFWGNGGQTDSKLVDAQAGYESSLTTLLTTLSGANITYGAGCLESGLTFDFAKFVLDIENFTRVGKVIAGIDLSDESLALDIIKEVGPGGEFMTHPHTFKHMREMSIANLFDRRNREVWLEMTGGQEVTERAYAEAERIIKEHKAVPVSEAALRAMDGIIKEFESQIK